MAITGLSLQQIVRHDPELAKQLIDAGADPTSVGPVDAADLALAGSDAFVRYHTLVDRVGTAAAARTKRNVVEAVLFGGTTTVVAAVAAAIGMGVGGPAFAAVAALGSVVGVVAASSTPSGDQKA